MGRKWFCRNDFGIVLAVLGVLVTVAADAGADEPAKPVPVRLIFDTDIMGDVDDVGTVALLHALADRGEVEILAMGVSAANPDCPLCLAALNRYFGRGAIPLGVVKGPAHRRDSRYAGQIAREFPHAVRSADELPDAALLYRKVLAAEPDASVVLVSVGQLTNMRNLLKTGPDETSKLSGKELVARKIKCWVCMGGKVPGGREANLVNDGGAAQDAINNWPTPIFFSGFEIGREVMTGARLKETPKGNPVRRAYQLYNGLKNRESWDQTAALFAVRGFSGGLDDVWSLARGRMVVAPDGSNTWEPSADGPHTCLVKKMPPEQVAQRIEGLMLDAVQRREKGK